MKPISDRDHPVPARKTVNRSSRYLPFSLILPHIAARRIEGKLFPANQLILNIEPSVTTPTVPPFFYIPVYIVSGDFHLPELAAQRSPKRDELSLHHVLTVGFAELLRTKRGGGGRVQLCRCV